MLRKMVTGQGIPAQVEVRYRHELLLTPINPPTTGPVDGPANAARVNRATAFPRVCNINH